MDDDEKDSPSGSQGSVPRINVENSEIGKYNFFDFRLHLEKITFSSDVDTTSKAKKTPKGLLTTTLLINRNIKSI